MPGGSGAIPDQCDESLVTAIHALLLGRITSDAEHVFGVVGEEFGEHCYRPFPVRGQEFLPSVVPPTTPIRPDRWPEQLPCTVEVKEPADGCPQIHRGRQLQAGRVLPKSL